MRHVFDIGSEPHGAEWRALVEVLRPLSACVQLVVRDELALSARGQALLDALAPHLRERVRAREWPGTVLGDGEATLLRYKTDALPAIVGAADGLFDWRQSELPEDLALLRIDGSVLLAAITHERDGWLEVSDDELASIRLVAPNVRLLERH